MSGARVLRAPALDGLRWLREGFALFDAAWGRWCLLTLSVMAPLAGLSLVPAVGTYLLPLLLPAVTGAFFAAAGEVERGGAPTFSVVASVWRSHGRRLLGVGVVALLVHGLVDALLAVYVRNAAFDYNPWAPPPYRLISLWGAAPFFAAQLFFAFVFAFAPAAVVLRGRDVTEAVNDALSLTVRNLPALFVYGAVCLPLLLLAAASHGVGLVVFLPVTLAAQYTAVGRVLPREG